MKNGIIKRTIAAMMSAALMLSTAPAEMGGMVISSYAAEKLPSPTGITAYNIKKDSISLKWNSVKGADAYIIYKYNETTKTFDRLGIVSKTKITLTKLRSDTTYTYKIAAAVKSGSKYIGQKKTKKIVLKTKGSGSTSDGSTVSAGIKVGSAIKFGKYEQDNNKSNGAEDIEWIVLDVKDGKALVLSKYVLDKIPYHEIDERKFTTWEKCTLRKWMNDTFYNSAFSAAEKKRIVLSALENRTNEIFKMNSGNDTKDNIFCLSIDEAEKYFKGEKFNPMTGYHEIYQSDKLCANATAYAVANGCFLEEGYDPNMPAERELDAYYIGYTEWYLRNQGTNMHYFNADPGAINAACVNYRGAITDGPYSFAGVRPAMWISIK